MLIISTEEMTAADICSTTEDTLPDVTCIVCDPRTPPRPASGDALVAADEGQLTALLAAHDADFTLCVVPPGGAAEVRLDSCPMPPDAERL